MKKLLLAGILFASGLFTSAHATTNCALTSGASTATVQAAVTAAAANSCTVQTVGGISLNASTVLFQAGSYAITSQVSIPCPTSAGMVLQGIPPASTSKWPFTYTSNLTSSIGNNWAFKGVACPNGTTIRYLSYDAQLPAGGGGGFLYVNPGMNNLTVTMNKFVGVNAVIQSTQFADTFIFLDGSNATARTVNSTITLNQFGQVGGKECGGNGSDGNPAGANGGLMNLYGGGNHCASGGYGSGSSPCLYQGASDITHGGGSCGGIGIHVNYDNLLISKNSFTDLEQPMKLYQPPSGLWSSTNLIIQNNDLEGTHRIGVELQSSVPSSGPSYLVDGNSFHDPIQPNAGQWALSLPSNTTINDTNNVLVSNVALANDKNGQGAFYAGYAVEFWGVGTSSNNQVQGLFKGGIAYGFGSAPRSINNNTIQGSVMSSGSNFINNEEGTSPAPSQSGNVTGATPAAITSIAPSISPAAGAQSFPLVVTLTDPGYTSGPQPLGNTGIWYTIDGTTPVPGAGTALYLPNGGSFTLASAATVKAVGMWGAINQPTSYPSGYGFVPSSAVSTTYTSGAATIVSGHLSTTPVDGVNTALVGGTIQFAPVANYSTGPPPVVIPASACSWTTTDPTVITVDAATGIVTAVGAGVANVQATCSSVAFSPWQVTVSTPVGPTLVSMSTSPIEIYSTGPVSLTAVGTFSDNTIGSVTATWVSSNPTVAAVDTNGNVVPTGWGTSYITATNGTLTSTTTVVVPPTVLYDNTIPNRVFPYSNSNFGCFVFQKLPTGSYTLVVNADGSFTVTP